MLEAPAQRRTLSFTIALTAATIGVIYGYDTGSIAGALLFIPARFSLSTGATEWVATFTGIGLIVGALAANRIADHFGRRVAMIALTVGFLVFAVLQGIAPSIVVLDSARFLLGVAIGISTVVAPVYIAESAPARIRGALIVGYQVATVVGIMVAYFVAWALAGGEHWRWMLAISAIPAALVLLVLLRLPDTPRWYMMKGRVDEARATFARTDPEADVERELEDIQADLRAERGGEIRTMLRKPYLRATIFVVVLGFLVQITGINAITYYSPSIFKELGWSDTTSLLVQGFIELFSVFAVVGAVLVVDRLGRRKTLLTGVGVMIAANILMVLLFSFGSLDGGFESVLGFVGILFFTAGFNFGFGALVWVYASESFPAPLRTAGASAMLTADLLANLLISRFFLTVFEDLGGAGTFGLFLALAVISFVFISAFAPETKGRPLEDIRRFWENGGSWPEEPVR
ncbi:MAG TPA: sugar porter family MFS transporter [Solirubrobacteraceae bacterium]|jgi:sugar porter (SP) family MFS transporter|nr:sugar porter family MFS transporter [Solirubrobacteraceae bacterium]